MSLLPVDMENSPEHSTIDKTIKPSCIGGITDNSSSSSSSSSSINIDKPGTGAVNEHFQFDIRTMAVRIDELTKSLKEIQAKMNAMEEARENPLGCGFSCSNNTFAM